MKHNTRKEHLQELDHLISTTSDAVRLEDGLGWAGLGSTEGPKLSGKLQGRRDVATFILVPLAPGTVSGAEQALLQYLNAFRCTIM